MKKSNFELTIEFIKWYTENRKWQSRILLVTFCLSIYSGDIYKILSFLTDKIIH